MAKLGEITGKTGVLYLELGEITGKTRVLYSELGEITGKTRSGGSSKQKHISNIFCFCISFLSAISTALQMHKRDTYVNQIIVAIGSAWSMLQQNV